MKRVLLAVAVLLSVYFPAAFWLRNTYQPAKGPPGGVHKLAKTFYKWSGRDGYAFSGVLPFQLDALADDNVNRERSPLVLYEDGRPLGPGHSPHPDVRTKGGGRFSHWKGMGLLFSSSDNSDPNLNGRDYWVVIPNSSDEQLRTLR